MFSDEQARNERLAALLDYNRRHHTERAITGKPLTANQLFALIMGAGMVGLMIMSLVGWSFLKPDIPTETPQQRADVIGAARHYENTRGTR
jgi:hypothetical protein